MVISQPIQIAVLVFFAFLATALVAMLTDLAAHAMLWGLRKIGEGKKVAPTGCQHVIPIDDDRPHRESRSCDCHPTDVGDNIWVHHAWDLREAAERRGECHPDKRWLLVYVDRDEP